MEWCSGSEWRIVNELEKNIFLSTLILNIFFRVRNIL